MIMRMMKGDWIMDWRKKYPTHGSINYRYGIVLDAIPVKGETKPNYNVIWLDTNTKEEVSIESIQQAPINFKELKLTEYIVRINQ